jgi:hypothetical protein
VPGRHAQREEREAQGARGAGGGRGRGVCHHCAALHWTALEGRVSEGE